MLKIRKRDILWKMMLGLAMLPVLIKYLCFSTIFFSISVILAYNFPDKIFNRDFIWITISFILILIIIISLILTI